MISQSIKDEYFDWICDLVCGKLHARKITYRRLLVRLYDTTFNYIIPMDVNRLEDGVNLRYRFGREAGYPQTTIASCLDNEPCSILEMMAALASRCEDSIMYDPDEGDRTYIWFWQMVNCLGLMDMRDEEFDIYYVDDVLERFIRRGYKRNGQGGLFKTKDRTKDMRSIEIWYQMCIFLDEVYARHDI